MQKIVFLDQNKWIDLARAQANPHAYEEYSNALKSIVTAHEEQQILIPLTWANIYETQKINDPLRRLRLASLQSKLSAGHVFHCGKFRRSMELKTFFENKRSGQENLKAKESYISSNFFDAFTTREQQEQMWNSPNSYSLFTDFVASNSDLVLFDYMTNLPDQDRRYAVEKFSEGSQKLIQEMAKRVQRVAGEPTKMRRKVYRAICFMEFQDEINAIAAENGLYKNDLQSDYGKLVREALGKLPCFVIETEVALKVDLKIHSVNENHLRDMDNVCTAIPYADAVVLENEFAGIVEQAQLGKKFNTQVFTNIAQLKEIL